MSSYSRVDRDGTAARIVGFLGGHQRIELRNLDRVLSLLVLAEAEQVGFVLRPPAIEVELVLGHDRLAAVARPARRRARRQIGTPGGPLLRPCRVPTSPAVDLQRVLARRAGRTRARRAARRPTARLRRDPAAAAAAASCSSSAAKANVAGSETWRRLTVVPRAAMLLVARRRSRSASAARGRPSACSITGARASSRRRSDACRCRSAAPAGGGCSFLPSSSNRLTNGRWRRAATLGDRVAVEFQIRLCSAGSGSGRPRSSCARRAMKHDAGLGLVEHRQQRVEPGQERLQPGFAGERFVGAVVQQNHGRLERQHVLLEMREAVGHGAKAGPGLAEHVVAAPAQVAKLNVAAGESGWSARLPDSRASARARSTCCPAGPRGRRRPGRRARDLPARGRTLGERSAMNERGERDEETTPESRSLGQGSISWQVGRQAGRDDRGCIRV